MQVNSDPNNVEQHLINLGFSDQAIVWLSDLWEVTQGLDDWRDGDEVDNRSCEDTIYKSLVSLPCNPFFLRNAGVLGPVLSQFVVKWSGANTVEDEKDVSETSFVWRSAYYDVVVCVATIEHGYKTAMDLSPYILKMYGEQYTDYLEEFNNG
jgi:hypothetical protein